MKKLSFLLVVLAFLSVAHSAFPDPSQSPIFYPVNSATSDTEIHGFDLGQTPYLYLKLPSGEYESFYSTIHTAWYNGGEWVANKDEFGTWTLAYHPTLTETLTFDWNNPANVGTWNIAANYSIFRLYTTEVLASGEGNTWFTISDPNAVPEPVSMVLFLLGGATLAGRHLLRKK